MHSQFHQIWRKWNHILNYTMSGWFINRN